MPPNAAITGNAALDRLDSSRSTTARLTSSSTSMKKTTISPSLTHSSNGFAMARPPTWTATGSSRSLV